MVDPMANPLGKIYPRRLEAVFDRRGLRYERPAVKDRL